MVKLDKILKMVDYKSKSWRDAYLEHRAIERNIGRQ
jgi:hypothetical protein